MLCLVVGECCEFEWRVEGERGCKEMNIVLLYGTLNIYLCFHSFNLTVHSTYTSRGLSGQLGRTW